MTDLPDISFVKSSTALTGVAAVVCAADIKLGNTGRDLNKASDGLIERAAKVAGFTGARRTSMELLSPAGLKADKLVVVGLGDPTDLTNNDWWLLGGYIQSQTAKSRTSQVTVALDGHAGKSEAAAAACLAAGLALRAYNFNRYKTRGNGKENGNGNGNGETNCTFRIAVDDPKAAEEKYAEEKARAEGVVFARDLVNEPANVLGPVEFADRLSELSALGVEIEVLDDAQLEEAGLRALLAVGQGSARPSRLVVMQWHGTESKRAKPVCFVGKGVVFDTGGISLKPAKGMEDMKGDMAGAAAVAGLMKTVALRKAKASVLGVVGLVENMPGADAQRPGDVVTSMSGQTIEVINTDAEGRLVLADALTFVLERHKPKIIVDLATLTGAIMVALGKEYAGLFSNNDRLAGWLAEAGEATGEKLWRMPLSPAYDKLIDSKIADMKNVGGPYGGAITAAQFLQRFVDETPWAHLDIAGTGMASSATETNRSWGSGFGVRLLDELIAKHYES